ncbi:MAG: Pr6Pr family membrane protein [Microbacteriaceae bacterium]
MAELFEPLESDRTGTRPTAFAATLRRSLGVINILTAFVIAIALTINITDRVLQGKFDPTHYFQYFTIQTCILNIVVLTAGGIYALTRTTDPRRYVVLRASTVAYAVLTGVVYNVLLAGIPANDGYIESSGFPNAVEHVWAPIIIAIEWLLMPGRSRLSWRVLWIAVVYPLLWVIGSMVRGLAGDGWYPYFFLNVPDTGVTGVVIYVAGLAAFIVGITATVVATGRLHSRVFTNLGVDRSRL